jgi:hypothetical protein
MGCGEPSCAIASRCFLTSVVSGSVPAPSHPRPRPRVKHPQDSPLICRGCSHSHLQTQPPRRTAMQKLRIVTVGFSGGRWLTRPFRDVSLDKIVARAEGYTFAATVWDLSIVEGPFSAAPCHNPSITLRFAPSRLRCAPPLCSHHEGQAGHSLQLPTRIVASRVQGGTLVPVSRESIIDRPPHSASPGPRTDSRSARLGQHLGEDPPLCS